MEKSIVLKEKLAKEFIEQGPKPVWWSYLLLNKCFMIGAERYNIIYNDLVEQNRQNAIAAHHQVLHHILNHPLLDDCQKEIRH